MKIKSAFMISMMFFSAVVNSSGQTKPSLVEYLGIPGPVTLNKIAYNLAWTSHPSVTYYKQEYIPAGEKVENYKKMISIELLISDATPENLAKTKMDELKQLKQTNPVINYEIFKKDGEILLDFLISQNSADNRSVEIIERNVYRYKSFENKKEKGVMLFAASERAYGNGADNFLGSLKKNKPVLLNAVASARLPEIAIKE